MATKTNGSNNSEPPPPNTEENPRPLVLLAKNAYVIAVLSPLSLVIYTYERALVPLYGSGPTNEHLNKFVIAGALLAAVNPIALPPWLNWLFISIALAIAPNANYWVAVWTSREHNVILGTLKTHAYVILPLVFIMASPVMRALDQTTPRTGFPTQQGGGNAPLVSRTLRTIIIFFVANGLARDFWVTLGFLRHLSENTIYLGLAAVYSVLFIATVPPFPLPTLSSKPKKASKKIPGPKRKDTNPSAKSEKKAPPKPEFTLLHRAITAAAFAGVWSYAHRFLQNPVLLHPLKEPYTHPTQPIKVLSSVQSVTGVITVAEWLPPPGEQAQETEPTLHSARYLRASHSILGGVWTDGKVAVMPGEQPLKDVAGKLLGDSVYSAFTLQEAARLVNSTPKGKKNKYETALVIGLGTGISTGALIRHGIDTTIVEIDPAVYEAARTYFGLPDPGKDRVFLEDARQWVVRRSDAIESEPNLSRFDIVIHDCFSGGGVPSQLFTKEFWGNLKRVVDTEGVVVVNFAGIVESEASSLVVNTLLDSFNGNCRGFHDLFGELTPEMYPKEFINIILVCTPSNTPLMFRKGRTSDYLGSYLRQHVLASVEDREIDLKAIKDDTGSKVLTGSNNPLGPLQDAQGGHHWEVMREVLPDYHWETY